MTLFFLQLFLTITTNGDDLFGHNVTGGANGILNVDPLSLFGHELPVSSSGGVFNVAYCYVVLGGLRRRLRRAPLRQPVAHRAARGGRSARIRSPPR